ncbi:hypothetical protein [Micromonospora ureilytica]|uniref:DUF2637 domain-containing protein n=1 Tax=Micromonospora ureilytica TaxID=709868 RepID=A0ABS0JSQ1_9ACTN|nr:hypothetical protein [Micromonospora ureilytica]MBG6070056.1 hypothetical protein [Micromonospora ureilytica]
MSVEMVDQFLATVERHRGVLLAAGGVLLVLLVLAGWWARRRGNRGAAYRWAAGAVAVALSAEGMWEVATESLGFAWWKALLLFAFAELAMLNEAHQAKARVKLDREPGVHGVAVWVIAVGAGLIAASNAANTAEYLLRLGAPTLLAWQWWSDLIADRPDRERQPSRWIWTPQRLGVRLGLLQPGSLDDLGVTFRQRNVDRMVRLADRIDTGSKHLTGRRALKLRRLAQGSTPEMLAEVSERYRRGLDVAAVIFGDQPADDVTPESESTPVDPWDYAESSATVTPAPAEPAAKPRVSRPRARSLTSAQKVARAAAKLPDASAAQIAAKAGVSESTARRYMPPLPPAADLAESLAVPEGTVADHYARMGYDADGHDLASATGDQPAGTPINGTPVEVTA